MFRKGLIILHYWGQTLLCTWHNIPRNVIFSNITEKKIIIIRYQSFWIVVSSDLDRLLYSGNDQYSAKHLRGPLHRSLQCSLCILVPVVCMWILVTLVSLNSQLYFLNSRTPHRLYLGSLPLCCLQEPVVGKDNDRVQLICFPCLSNYCP